ncbi:hypothetical protein HPB47_016260 [Ixodes persulcatus]|uniref:Uncharacterized protein n=1 Tax=Ixodes persulcatus TaxID=34615 RepID=A0AC60R2J4_IXOPE|nr:hypothetical protein HPB47_016260 [Ixodes persulcatus]
MEGTILEDAALVTISLDESQFRLGGLRSSQVLVDFPRAFIITGSRVVRVEPAQPESTVWASAVGVVCFPAVEAQRASVGRSPHIGLPGSTGLLAGVLELVVAASVVLRRRRLTSGLRDIGARRRRWPSRHCGRLRTTPQSSARIEQNTRQQSRSATWKEERRLRLTSSNFGTAAIWKEWTLKGLQAMTSTRDISRVSAIKYANYFRYGITNEPLAAKRYEEVLRSMGHDVTITSCGLLVNPAFPWLGASPDRIVYDPEEASYGVVEIKCPYSLRETKGAELAGLSFYSKLSDSGPRLDRDNHYYSQVVGQMGMSGLSWADFVIYSGNFILIERIRLVQAEWDALKIKVEEFYFTTLLPYLGGSR